MGPMDTFSIVLGLLSIWSAVFTVGSELRRQNATLERIAKALEKKDGGRA